MQDNGADVANIWSLLTQAGQDWDLPALATQTEEGADVRIVVKRAVNAEERLVTFFTDRRSHKRGHLQAEPAVCLLFWSPAEQVQVRAYGRAHEVRDKERLDRGWENLRTDQKAMYAAELRPDPDAENDEGRENFTAFDIEITLFRCLWLREGGNRAVRFEWHGDHWTAEEERP